MNDRRGEARQLGSSRSRVLTRALALAALLCALVAITALLLSGGRTYEVHAMFANASQLVVGDQVEVAGTSVGSVSQLALARNGMADVTLQINAPDLTPLHQGVLATVREQGLTSISNRYIELHMPAAGTPAIPSGGTLPATATNSEVDLDEVLDTLNASTRQALQGLLQGSGAQYRGEAKAANLGFMFLDPATSTSDQLLAALNRDTPMLERFVVANAQLASDLTARPDTLGQLVDNLSTTAGAVAIRQRQLADALHTLPPFMGQADTTFAHLHTTLNRLTPVIDASKPVAPKLGPFFAALRSFAANARPTLANLAQIIRRPGPGNDLVDLVQSSVPVRNIAVGPVRVAGMLRPGAFPASTQALNGGTPELSFARPYSVDLTGWFSDFGHTGFTDAMGGTARGLSVGNAFALQGGTFEPIPPDLRQSVFSAVARTGMTERCPGSDERSVPGSPLPWRPTPGYPCDPSQGPLGR